MKDDDIRLRDPSPSMPDDDKMALELDLQMFVTPLLERELTASPTSQAVDRSS